MAPPASITVAVPSRSQLAFTLMLSASSVCAMVLKACDTLCAAVIAPSRAPAGQLVGLTRSLLGNYQNDARASWPAFFAHIRAPAQSHLGERFTIEIGLLSSMLYRKPPWQTLSR